MKKTGFISKDKDRYVAHCYINDKHCTFAYSKSRYGKDIAYKLAQMSLRDKRKYYDYFEIDNDIVSFYIYTKKFGICRMDIDIEDFELVSSSKINIEKNRYTYYAASETLGQIHRRILNVTDKSIVVDHLDKNGLNNCKYNLRPVSVSINIKNSKKRKDNKTGIRGVYIYDDDVIATYRDFNGKPHKKSFSFNKYGKEKAIQLAKEARLQAEKKYGYIEIDESSETNPDKFVGYLLIL